MRQTTSGNFTIKYPDEVSFAFNPVLVIVTPCDNVIITAMMGGVSRVLRYEAINGNVYADLQQIAQLYFATVQFGLNYSSTKQNTNLGSTLSLTIQSTSGADTATVSVSTYVVWGAMNPNGKDVFNGYRKQKYFVGYPFTFGFFTTGQSTLVIGYNGSPQTSLTIGTNNQKHMVEVNGNQLPQNAMFSNIYDYAGTLQQGYFDNTFDLTFYMWQNVAQTLLARIDIESCPDEDTVYLRWIDRHGFYCYWLWNYKNRQRTTAYTQEFGRVELQEYDYQFGYERGAGRRVAYERNNVTPLAVPLADVEQYKYLLDIISSPCVDMYIGKDTNQNPRWQTVAVQAGTYTQTDKEMQDFVINLITPSVPVQRL